MRGKESAAFFAAGIMFIAIVFGSMYFTRVSDAETIRVVENAGYAYVTPGDIYGMCGRDYRLGRHWVADNAQGKESHGVVCCSAMIWTSYCTVRFD